MTFKNLYYLVVPYQTSYVIFISLAFYFLYTQSYFPTQSFHNFSQDYYMTGYFSTFMFYLNITILGSLFDRVN